MFAVQSPFHVSPGMFYVALMELMQEQQGQQQPRHAVAPQQQTGTATGSGGC